MIISITSKLYLIFIKKCIQVDLHWKLHIYVLKYMNILISYGNDGTKSDSSSILFAVLTLTVMLNANYANSSS